MSIDTFIQEIETRKKNDLAELDKKLNDKKSETDAKKNSEVKELKEKYTNEAKTKADREGARIVEAGKLEAKKILFDAINKNLDSVEIRFLRYSIQYNAPKLLGYTENIEEDYDFIINNINRERDDVKEFILPILKIIN